MKRPKNTALYRLQASEVLLGTATETHPREANARPGEPGARRDVRVLLVDNSPAVIGAIESMLASISWVHVIGTATSGEQALERIDNLEPNVVLLDFAMPGMDGLEVMRYLTGCSRRPRIIMMTAHVDDDYRQAAADAGADGFILKANLWDDLVALIRALWDRDDPGN